MTRLLTAAVAVVAAMPGMALAQVPDPPRVEWGAQASSQTGELRSLSWSPRITLNLTPLTAIEATADIRPAGGDTFGTRTSGQAYSLHWRQALFAAGRWRVFGVFGAGTSRRVQDFPGWVFEGRDEPQVMPPHRYVDSSLAVHLGPAVQFEAVPWLALRGDLRLTASHSGGLRGMVGAVVPIGRFRAGDRPGLAGPTPPLAAWQRVKPGREVWVTTTTGSLVHGEISAISGHSLSVRQQRGEVTVALDDVRLVEGRDSLRNGIMIGAGSGAVGGSILFGWAASAFCESDSCDPVAGVALALGAASGAAVGGLLGAMVDGVIPGRQTLFSTNTIGLTPTVTPTSKALEVTLSWR